MKGKIMQRLGGAEPSKTNGSFKKGVRPPRNQPCLREVFPGGQIGMRRYN